MSVTLKKTSYVLEMLVEQFGKYWCSKVNPAVLGGLETVLSLEPSSNVQIHFSNGLIMFGLPFPVIESLHSPGVDWSVIGVESGTHTGILVKLAVGGEKTLTGGSAVTGIQLFPSLTSTEMLNIPQLSS